MTRQVDTLVAGSAEASITADITLKARKQILLLAVLGTPNDTPQLDRLKDNFFR